MTQATMTEQLETEATETPFENPMEDVITVTPEEIIDAFEAVYEELVMLRNSVINLHERLEKIEAANGSV